MMKALAINQPNSFWLRTLVRIKPGTAIEPLRTRLYSVYRALEQERAKSFKGLPSSFLVGFPREKMVLKPAANGVSMLQEEYRESLVALGVLVLLVLLIACANVANLMIAVSAARAREMALRVSIGAGRWRLVQMVLVESFMMAILAAVFGALFAWWSAPLVVRMINPPDNPARLILSPDWRVVGFGVVLIAGVTLLFGLLPALRASAVKPVDALKGGSKPQSRRQRLHGMIALQVAFCFLVVFVGGLFRTSFNHLSQVRTGFSADRILAVETVSSPALSPVAWQQMGDHLRSIPGVEATALAGWPLMSGTMHNDPISVHGSKPSDVLAFFLSTSPGWMGTMNIHLLDGRDFRPSDANPQVAIVTRAFVRQFFGNENPIGQSFRTMGSKTEYQIVGVADDVVYRNLREPVLPIAFVPFQTAATGGGFDMISSATILVRTASENPQALLPVLLSEVHQARGEFRVSNIRTQREIIDAQTLRERMLAMLGAFFAGVALLLAGIGLYGVLNYSVVQRRREIGIRIAVGARRLAVTRLISAGILLRVVLGSIVGIAAGMGLSRYLQALVYQVKPSDSAMLTVPLIAIAVVTFLATVPAVARALRIDPAEILRSE
jgi:predicted permease